MITITSGLSGQYFSSLLPDASLSISGAKAAVAIAVDGEEIYSETLFPVGGTVELYDLSGLITPYARQRLAVSLTVDITEQDAEGTAMSTARMEAEVVYCEADMDTTAPAFLASHFLTTLQGPRVTAHGRRELLHCLGSSSASATGRYSDGSVKTVSLPTVGGNSRYTSFDSSPSHLETDGKTLISYTVSAGSRTQEYTMDLSEPDCAPVLVFANSFGCDELLYCTGTHTLDADFKRDTIRIRGSLRDVDVEEQRTKTADTGILSHQMADWAQDMLRSRSIRIAAISGGTMTVGKAITITEAKVKLTNDDDALPRIQFSYQYAQRNQHVMSIRREGRVFDDTFDNTFE